MRTLPVSPMIVIASALSHGGAALAMVELGPADLDRVTAGTTANAVVVVDSGPALLAIGDIAASSFVIGPGGSAATGGLAFTLVPFGVDLGTSQCVGLPPCVDVDNPGVFPSATTTGASTLDPASGPLAASATVVVFATGNTAATTSQASVTTNAGTNSASADASASGVATGLGASVFGVAATFAQN